MEKEITDILFNPAVGKIVTIFIGIAVIWILIKLVQKNLFSKIKDTDSRYRTKKLSSYLGYFFTLVLITVVYSDKLGGLTVALGVAGAGIAPGLQLDLLS